MASESAGKRTSLYAAAQAAGARFVDFGGWDMPVQFTGVVAEHEAVRTAAGLFDVSHMGEVRVVGPRALATVQRLICNDASTLGVNHSLYSPMCNPHGGIVDDCLVYCFGDADYLLVVNASNLDKDLAWIREQAAVTGAEVQDESEQTGLLALQGPKAAAILGRAAGQSMGDVGRNHVVDVTVAGVPCRAARTGYTGEDGFEMFVPADQAAAVWEACLHSGEDDGLVPCGLGARDTLRLEARLLLYGNDIDDSTTPLEAGLKWTVKLDKGDFVGREALLAQQEQGLSRRLVGFEVTGRGIARHGYDVFESGESTEPMGQVTSGTKSPTLAKAIGLAYVPSGKTKRGSEWFVDVRGRRVPAKVVRTPFYKRPEG